MPYKKEDKLLKLSRINVIGTSCSGKSTFSKKLAYQLIIPYIEIDQVYWKPNWQEPGDKEFFQKLAEVLEHPQWVLDGNYTRTTSIKWKNVQTVIWLDYPFYLVFYRTIKRSLNRAWTKKELWAGTGNTESFYRTFFTKDSMLYWVLHTYQSNRKKYIAAMNDAAYSHLQFIHITSPKQAVDFLKMAK